MSVSDYVRRAVLERLERNGILVWYDRERAFEAVAAVLPNDRIRLVSASESTLDARRLADAMFQGLPQGIAEAEQLLIYVARPRPVEDHRLRDPFEVYARIGGTFGDRESEELESLACQALPDRAAEIRRLFRAGRPTLLTLDELDNARRYPLVKQALGVDGPVEVAARLLCVPGTGDRIQAVKGAELEARSLLRETYGYETKNARGTLQSAIRGLSTYVLFSEFASDLDAPLPRELDGLPRAEEGSLEAVRALCDHMRGTDAMRDAYAHMAIEVEKDLGLAGFLTNAASIGNRDTFQIQDASALQRAVHLIETGALEAARITIEQRRGSLWRSMPERGLLWKLAERALEYGEVLPVVEQAIPPGSASVREHVDAYLGVAWLLDRQQRLLEQTVAEAAAPEQFATATKWARDRYRAIAGIAQDRFLAAVKRHGWPPDGLLPQTEVFDRIVGPLLADGKRVAFFLVDAMRYEMGRDLGEAIADLGSVSVTGVATVVPTTTPAGMAALMPGAHGAFRLVNLGGMAVPAIGERKLAGAADRVAYLTERFGDRYVDLIFDELVGRPARQLEARLANRDVVVVRTQEIDALGEGGAGQIVARRVMTDVLGWLRQATAKLAQLGFSDFVYAADHGFVLLPEVAAGDVVQEPPGQWLLRKRRSRLGKAAGTSVGTVSMPAPSLGLDGDVEDVVVPTGFRVFSRDAEYFHEGISLQECLVPVITLHVEDLDRSGSQGGGRVEVTYKSDRFTSRILGLRLRLDTLLPEFVTVRVEAFDGPTPKARRVGEAADCDARDERTGFVRLERGIDTQVPLRLEDDFSGQKIEVRVINADGPEIVLGRLALKSSMME